MAGNLLAGGRGTETLVMGMGVIAPCKLLVSVVLGWFEVRGQNKLWIFPVGRNRLKVWG